jgi:hypothetical protein
VGIRFSDHVTTSIRKSWPTRGGRSIGIVRSRTKATEFSFLMGCGWRNIITDLYEYTVYLYYSSELILSKNLEIEFQIRCCLHIIHIICWFLKFFKETVSTSSFLNDSFPSWLHGIANQAHSSFTYSYHRLRDPPHCCRPFRSYCRICFVIHPNGLSELCLHSSALFCTDYVLSYFLVFSFLTEGVWE